MNVTVTARDKPSLSTASTHLALDVSVTARDKSPLSTASTYLALDVSATARDKSPSSKAIPPVAFDITVITMAIPRLATTITFKTKYHYLSTAVY